MMILALPASAQTCQPSWQTLGSGIDGQINALGTWDPDGPGRMPELLFAGGPIDAAGGRPVNTIAQWDGSQWSGLGEGLTGDLPTVYAIASFDEDGPGPAGPVLFVGGDFTIAGKTGVSNIARWDGTNWSDVGGGVNGDVLAFLVHDDDGPGPHPTALYVGGEFTLAGGTPANFIARWDGRAWSSVGGGIGGSFPYVAALGVLDEDAAGPNPARLFVGGEFSLAGGVPVNNVARWNGTSWSALGSGINGFVNDFATFDPDAAGPQPETLYAAGIFGSAGGVQVNGVARWSGTAWSALGSGLNSGSHAVQVFDEDGAGPGLPALFVAGNFTTAGGMAINRIARWNGAAWSALGAGANGIVLDLVSYDPDGLGAGGEPASLVVAGVFSSAGGIPAARVAQWVGCEAGSPADINGDGAVDVDDLLAVITAWGPCPAPPANCAADTNDDGQVNVDDLLMVITNWG